MTDFTALEFEDLAVGALADVPQQLSPEMVARWRALVGYPPGSEVPASLALTWLLEALRKALDGIPAGGVLIRHEIRYGIRPLASSEFSTQVGVADLVTRDQRRVVVFQLLSRRRGELVVADRMHLIWPPAQPTGARRSETPPRQSTPVEPRDVLLRARVTQPDIDSYATLSGDFNPLHVDPEAGRRSRFGSTIAHGPLPLGFVQLAVENLLGTPWPVGLRLGARFVSPARPGDALEVRRVGENAYQLAGSSGRLLIDVRTRQEVD